MCWLTSEELLERGFRSGVQKMINLTLYFYCIFLWINAHCHVPTTGLPTISVRVLVDKLFVITCKPCK